MLLKFQKRFGENKKYDMGIMDSNKKYGDFVPPYFLLVRALTK